MSRILLVLSIVVAALAGVAGAQFYALNTLDIPTQDDIRAIASQVAQEQAAESEPADPAETELANLDPAVLNPLIESFLMDNPKVLQRVSERLQTVLREEEQQSARVALAALETEIYEDPANIIVGNPDGDVTIVEFYDYNCGYCRQSLSTVARLIEEDPNLRVIFKEFPVLSNESLEAAKVAVAVSQLAADQYWDFHERLLTARGQINGINAAQAATELGIDPLELQQISESPETMAALQRTYAIARNLEISGTPTFIVGGEILPGAYEYDAIKQRIDNIRTCGETICAPAS